MFRNLNVSSTLYNRLPKRRRTHTLSNLQWISRNMNLSPLEAREVADAITALKSKESFLNDS